MSQNAPSQLMPVFIGFVDCQCEKPFICRHNLEFNVDAVKVRRAVMPILQVFLNLRREETRINIELLHVAKNRVNNLIYTDAVMV